jgi:ATP-dependent RNA helicase DDX54/DBP10
MGKSGLFEKFGFNPVVVRGVRSQGYNLPTPVQRKSIPRVMAGQDVIAMARTGSGKTLAFLAPIIHKLEKHAGTVGVRAVILALTRELALQTLKFAIKTARFTDLRFAGLVGGDGLSSKFDKLASNPDVIVATPNRLMHLMTELNFTLKSVEIAVLDEADRLLEKGFNEVVVHILKTMSLENRQTLCFSATLPDSLTGFVKTGLRNPVLIQLDQEHILPETLALEFFIVRQTTKKQV